MQLRNAPIGFTFTHWLPAAMDVIVRTVGAPDVAEHSDVEGRQVVYLSVETLEPSLFGPTGSRVVLTYFADAEVEPTEPPAPKTRFRITIEFDVEAPDTAETREAVENLASVMIVQAEDGLYTLGSPESENGQDENKFLGHVSGYAPQKVEVVR